MKFQILIAVCMFAVFVQYVESNNTPFLVNVHHYYPKPPGTCLYIICENSTKGASYDCIRKFSVDNKRLEKACGLKTSNRAPNDFDETDENGTLTGNTGIIEKDGNVYTYVMRNHNGQIIEIMCGTYETQIDDQTKQKVDENCAKVDKTHLTTELDVKKC